MGGFGFSAYTRHSMSFSSGGQVRSWYDMLYCPQALDAGGRTPLPPFDDDDAHDVISRTLPSSHESGCIPSTMTWERKAAMFARPYSYPRTRIVRGRSSSSPVPSPDGGSSAG